jgi:hypothetical protein
MNKRAVHFLIRVVADYARLAEKTTSDSAKAAYLTMHRDAKIVLEEVLDAGDVRASGARQVSSGKTVRA